MLPWPPGLRCFCWEGNVPTALIIHGTCSQEEYLDERYPSSINSHWLPWLLKQLLMAGYAAQTPTMPLAYQPVYADWAREFQRHELGPESLLVGHSCGSGFLLRWLAENPVPVRRLVLVAPWLDPFGRKCPDFFRFDLDPALSARAEMHLVFSDNDGADINESVRRILAAYPSVKQHLFPGYGHFCYANLRTAEFPELRGIVLRGLN